MASVLRLHVPLPMHPGAVLDLPTGAVRHVQVRRLQPGDSLRLFDGHGQEWQAQLLAMGRQSASVQLLEPAPALPELRTQVTLALGVPANERMDSLVEKATELGVACIQPLLTERSVLRLQGERAQRRVEHWAGVAAAAAEQCGRATVPQMGRWCNLAEWLSTVSVPTSSAGTAEGARWLLSPQAGSDAAVHRLAPPGQRLLVLSGPEGGLSAAEETSAKAGGFVPVHLGPRVLRADTAPLAVLAWLGLRA
jgi:16S rRNA (uracil1498-N3)-methyltransferase